MCMRLFELTSYDLTGQAPCVVFGVLLAVRHEVASITVKSALTEFHPLSHQRFPTGTCGIGNDPVRSCRNNVASSH